MARRMLAWLLVTPVAATGVLGAHAVSYWLTGTTAGSIHAYLGHVPQVVAVLASIGLVGLAVQERSFGRLPLWPFALVGPLGFTCQEHVERLAHTGELPFLLTTPSFAVGLVLQLPVALLCVRVARHVAGALVGARGARAALLGEAWLPLPSRPSSQPRQADRPRATERSPPRALAS
jgi:hypothetical protein